MSPAERLAALAGAWQVWRAIRHGDGRRARFEGRAVWAPEGRVLRCTEDGTLVQGGQSFPATRETLWRADTTRLFVTFADGRPFHDFAPMPRAEAKHDCAPDTYALVYDFRAAGFWTCRWDVRGPRKAYRALTRHRRMG